MSAAAEPEDEDDATTGQAGEATPVIPTETLFAGRREVVVLHDGVRYRLRITRKNKLILQK